MIRHTPHVFAAATVGALLFAPVTATAQDFTLTASSYQGGAGDDRVAGARIQPSGTILIAGALGDTTPRDAREVLLGDATSKSTGAVMRLSPDGKRALSLTRVTDAPILDIAIDATGRIYLAAGDGGLLVLDPLAESILWKAQTIGHVHRVSASADGHVAALIPSNSADADTKAGAGRVHLFSPSGEALKDFAGHRNTQDVCLDGASKTIGLIGWRQANAFDGNTTNPVQIAYLRGVGFDGEARWTAYDWSTDRDAEGFINRPENNMADTRGYRCSIGADGKLYAAFESAGGNHIFRYSTTDITKKVSIVGGDRYHEWYNSRSEHKLFFARYEPADGAYLLGQQFAGRISSGRTNTVRAKSGEIVADAQGRVVITASSAASLPIDDADMYPGTGEYKGGAYLLIMSADFTKRLHINRVSPNATGHAAAIRAFDEASPNVVYAGSTKTAEELYRVAPWQDAFGGGETDGFVAVFNGVIPAGWDPGDAGAGDMGQPTPGSDMGTAGGRDMDSARDMGDVPETGDTPPASTGEEGCGCRTPGAPSHPAAPMLLLTGALLGLLRRRAP